jgi:hypothetical protein
MSNDCINLMATLSENHVIIKMNKVMTESTILILVF